MPNPYRSTDKAPILGTFYVASFVISGAAIISFIGAILYGSLWSPSGFPSRPTVPPGQPLFVILTHALVIVALISGILAARRGTGRLRWLSLALPLVVAILVVYYNVAAYYIATQRLIE